MIDLVGWVATAVFVGSYFCKRPEVLRRMQMVGALIWVAYGILMPAPPVIAANLLVVAAAAWTARGAGARRSDDRDPRDPREPSVVGPAPDG